MSVTTTVWCSKRHTSIPKSQFLTERAAEASRCRSDLPFPMIISDCMSDTRSMVDGQIYTSKRAYEQSVRAAGCEIIGNENPAAHTTKPLNEKQHEADIAADVKTAIAQVEARL